jgi:thioester reductase-like protein
MGDVVLVTGYPGFIGRQLVRRLVPALRGREARLVLLVQAKHAARARAELVALGAGGGEVLEGDVAQIHLGLSSAEYRGLAAGVTAVWHLAAVSFLGAESDLVRRVNVEGTRHVLELCRAAPGLARLNHFSTAFVSGDRVGVILEDELEMGQRFRNEYEDSKCRAEVLVRAAMRDLPVTVYRPSIVVGDSRTGEIDRFEGPYYLAILLVASPLRVPLPLPGDGVAPLNVVPVDFVVEAALSISANPAAVGKTVHVVDPSPLSARKVYQLIAGRVNRRLPPVTLPHRAVEALLSLPVLERIYRPQRAAIASVNHLALYNCRNMLSLLEGTGLQCPPITSYLDRLIGFVRAEFDRRRRGELEAQVDDPLDPPASGEGP